MGVGTEGLPGCQQVGRPGGRCQGHGQASGVALRQKVLGAVKGAQGGPVRGK
jgi:hypothetical protein